MYNQYVDEVIEAAARCAMSGGIAGLHRNFCKIL